MQHKLNVKQVVELADDVELRMEYYPDVEFGSDPYTFLHHANARLFLKSQDQCIGSIESDVFYQMMRLDVPELSSQVTHRLARPARVMPRLVRRRVSPSASESARCR